jgi:NAD(P)-dependent dehydrogenase (short-subunit alcohol dehydrogenase family)
MQLFAREGAKVVGVARRQAVLEQVLANVEAEGGEGAIVAADLSVESEAQAMLDAAIARYRRIDVLVNCAGVGYAYRDVRPGSMDPIDTTSSELWDEVMAINLGSAVYMIRLVIPVMRQHEGGSIVNVASISGFTGLTAAHTYTAALINLTRSLAITYARDGIRSNVVAPGFVDTPMIEAVIGMFDDETLRWQLSPMGRPATAEEIAYGCLFFASDESAYCNGSVLAMDGGTTAKGA